MKPRAIVLMLAALLVSIGAQVTYSQRPCDGLVAAARSSCLQREAARTRAAADRANANLAQLNARMNIACRAASILDATAKAAAAFGEITSNRRFVFGGRSWSSIREIMTTLTRERANCEGLRRAAASIPRSP